MSFLDRLLGRQTTRHPIAGVKAMELPFVTTWQANYPQWPVFSWSRLVSEGFFVNTAFSACVSRYAMHLNEPPLRALDRNAAPLEAHHSLQALLTRPNPWQGHSELMSMIGAYLLTGGNAYLHKVRNGAGQPLELYAYHDGHFTPIPGRDRPIVAYDYDVGDGNRIRVPAEDVVHLKWSLPDFDQPWRSVAPLRLLAREVDADTEMTRLVWALMKKDAMVRTLIVYPQGVTLTPDEREAAKQRFQLLHSGDNYGGIGIATEGATVQRMSLNMQELDMTALRRIPETRICAVCLIPAMLVGLAAGLERSTYSNYAEARTAWTEDTLVPLWGGIAGELEADLASEFGEYTVEFDLTKVRALQENETERVERAISLYDGGIATKNEARVYVGFPRWADAQKELGANFDPEGDVFKTSTAPALAPPIDVTPEALMLEDGEKNLKHGSHNQQTHANRYGKGFGWTKSHFKKLNPSERKAFKKEARKRRDGGSAGSFKAGDTLYPSGRQSFASKVIRRESGGYIVKPIGARSGSFADQEFFVPFGQASATVSSRF